MINKLLSILLQNSNKQKLQNRTEITNCEDEELEESEITKFKKSHRNHKLQTRTEITNCTEITN